MWATIANNKYKPLGNEHVLKSYFIHTKDFEHTHTVKILVRYILRMKAHIYLYLYYYIIYYKSVKGIIDDLHFFGLDELLICL